MPSKNFITFIKCPRTSGILIPEIGVECGLLNVVVPPDIPLTVGVEVVVVPVVPVTVLVVVVVPVVVAGVVEVVVVSVVVVELGETVVTTGAT